MKTRAPSGVVHAYRCPHCRKIQQWEIALDDDRHEWHAKCQDCGGDVVVRHDAARDTVTGYAP